MPLINPTSVKDIAPIRGHVLALSDTPETVTPHGIVLLQKTGDERNRGSTAGTVRAMASDVDRKMLKVGDKILYHQFAGQQMEVTDDEGRQTTARMMKFEDISCVLT